MGEVITVRLWVVKNIAMGIISTTASTSSRKYVLPRKTGLSFKGKENSEALIESPLKLPKELLFRILYHCHFPSLLKLSQTCHYFCHLFSSESVWKQFCEVKRIPERKELSWKLSYAWETYPHCRAALAYFSADQHKLNFVGRVVGGSTTFLKRSIPIRRKGLLVAGSRRFSVLMLGLDDAGKTTLLHRTNHPLSKVATTGIDAEFIQQNNVTFYCLDVGGKFSL